MTRTLLAVMGFLLAGCASGPPAPAALDTRSDTCRFCRMVVSDARFAAQIVAPREDPLFFDDIGCLARYLAQSSASSRSIAYVADHRTRAWVPATRAVYTRVDTTATPMAGGVLAHADRASRDADPAARNGIQQTAADVFRSGRLPGAQP
jgi:copper chaperone NosL